MTPGLLMNTMLTIMVMIVITRGQLMLENMDTTVVLSVKTRRSRSATRIPKTTCKKIVDTIYIQECHKHPHENSRKIPKTTCKKIVDTIYIEECEEIIHTVCE